MAEPNEIIDALEGLALFCRPNLMAVDDRSRWMAAWVSDLKAFPLPAIHAACERWRHGDNPKFPMPGQLLPLVRAAHVKGPDAEKGPPEWRELTDAEYDGLTIREKIRHQLILQQQAQRKAGPQWLHGKPCPAEEMPPIWHAWRARAANHGKEAKRLQDKLAEYDRKSPGDAA